MYASKKTLREEKFLNPSFSSTLLDQIYRSIDDGERKSPETKFYRDTTGKKQSRTIPKRTDNNVVRTHCTSKELVFHDKLENTVVAQLKNNRRSRDLRDVDGDQDVLFYSSTSISSDSSSGGLSFSDTESRASSCLAPRPKHVRTSVSEKQGTRVLDGLTFCRNSSAEEALIKSKWRIYNNLKKMKQPISPGARLTSFLNSLFATRSAKKTRKTAYEEVKAPSSACYASSRSCLSKTPSSERLSKTVRFYPVSVVLGEDEGSREFYRYDKKKNVDLVLKDLSIRTNVNKRREETNEYEDEDDDDVASCASSDLFELDHLAVFGSERYCEELPVYETTNVSTLFNKRIS